MRLRKQLFFASLFTLSLPWVGCQYVREMEDTLLKGQAEALQATAIAVAATIENDPNLSQIFTHFAAPPGSTPMYLQPFHSPLTLDGYDEDWASYAYAPQHFSSHEANALDLSVLGGQRNSQAWLFFQVPTEHISYYNPSRDIHHASRIQLTLVNAAGHQTEHTIVAASPGQALSFIGGENKPERDHQIKGVWREWSNGYQLELSLPFTLLAQGMRFDILAAEQLLPRYSNDSRSDKHTAIPPVIFRPSALQEKLAIFEREGTSLKLAASNSALVATTGKISARSNDANIPWVLSTIFQFALGNERYAPLPQPQLSGFFSHAEVLQSLLGQAERNRYDFNGKTVSTVSVPLRFNNRVLGAVYTEQSAQSLSGFTDQAFSRLLLYSIAVSMASALMLVLYASWLSYRISRLSRSAAGAISESGKIAEGFKSSRLHDEVGDLSRSFAQLLSRLKEYTHYLKTLSSKLSHELRTPLAIVSSSLDNLEHEALPDTAKVYAQRAKEGTTRLSGILNAMSAASRVEQAIGSAELEHIPLNELVKSLSEAYSDVYSHVRFSLNIQATRAGFDILASAELLVQMLDKLVDNAADFCPANGCIELGLYRHDNTLVITVRNEGPPLPQTMHKQLFDSMVSVREKPTQTTTRDHHLGLGLYIVRLIVDFHQGSVQAYNLPDQSGVIFEIRLPSNV